MEYYYGAYGDYGGMRGPAAALEGIPEILGPVLIAVFMTLMMILLVFSAVVYVLQALGLYTMAKRRGLESPWLAWIPVGSAWLMGRVVDDIGRRKGKNTSYAIILLVLTAATMAGSAALFLLPLVGMFSWIISVGLMVATFMALYEIFSDYAPDHSVLFLVLSLLFSIQWAFLFAIRNRRPVTLGGGIGRPGARPEPASGPGWQPPTPHPTQPFGQAVSWPEEPPVPQRPIPPMEQQADWPSLPPEEDRPSKNQE